MDHEGMPLGGQCEEANLKTAGEPVEDAGRQLSMEELRGILHTVPARNFGELPERSTVGVGGVGAVFTALDPGLNRMVAIKVLRPPHRTDSKFIDALIPRSPHHRPDRPSQRGAGLQPRSFRRRRGLLLHEIGGG